LVPGTLLADEESKALYDQLIVVQIPGHLHVRLPFNNSATLEQTAIAGTWKVAETSDSGMFGPLAIYSVPMANREIRVKCWAGNAAATFMYGQLLFLSGGGNGRRRSRDHVIDAGSCLGTRRSDIAHEVGETGHVYAFDPIGKHCNIMRESFAMNPDLVPRISIFEAGLANENREGSSTLFGARIDKPRGALNRRRLHDQSIDGLVADGALPRVDFIKMDIEGRRVESR
jgi:FkbM family methyltransferase